MAIYSDYFSRVLQLLNLNLECVALLLQIHRILLKNNDYSKFILKLLKKNFFSSKLQAKGLVGQEHVLFVFYLLFFPRSTQKSFNVFFFLIYPRLVQNKPKYVQSGAFVFFFSEICFIEFLYICHEVRQLGLFRSLLAFHLHFWKFLTIQPNIVQKSGFFARQFFKMLRCFK